MDGDFVENPFEDTGGHRYVALEDDDELPEAPTPDMPHGPGAFAVRKVVDHLGVQAVVVLLIVLDLIFLIVGASDSSFSHTSEILSNVILAVFGVELVLRIYGFQKLFFKDFWMVFDGLIVVVAIVVTAALGQSFARAVLVARLLRIGLLVVRVRSKYQAASASARHFVSMNKQRYQKNGFDLDLTYVTQRVIAMSTPAVLSEAVYRNPIDEVVRFFETMHPHRYWIYNVTSEKDYDFSKFHFRVSRFSVDDHNVPTLNMMYTFCKEAAEWMMKDAKNVIAVHCKGGKGRTGTMVCGWLLYNGDRHSAEEALQLFGQQRTDFSKGSRIQGVETPSQRRYVGYFERVLKEGPFLFQRPRAVTCSAVRLLRCPSPKDGPAGRTHEWRLKVYVFTPPRDVEPDAKEVEITLARRDADSVVFDMGHLELCGDVKFLVTRDGKKYCYWWFHTSFLDANSGRFELPKREIDKMHKDMKQHLLAGPDFALQVDFKATN